MDARLDVVPLPTPRARDLPRWEVRHADRVIGRVIQKRIGRGMFYEAYVTVDGQEVCLEANIDLEERCEKVLAAWLDPRSTPQTRYWLRLEG